ncbi:sulfite oxidase-like oxidoreductase [Bacillus swezeyi]|uniref:Sulfite oxidase-like oxidoreductase n=1 Tax=Bacillus swezeyi TaxID=1925020 RepID=A0A1R1QEF6_9BACI|nr:sulfite oxidase-like oxidoreductase [Bacillus swezeyi]MEC1262157.1 sulfite oxidase-like oxidoreductase [Bacillus swezeyi]MED2927275.1 sulfite oxidase-like oxidoreductase [Bacillus swezeyi]MED2962473.1 sulfite oxidase-like oxidoreductase [Bacillus swezeyi]MED2977075.1 sulfite oxidase-like oxidoreductase [Bacillus swezeyi]MED3072072.1 sulfite oxidase-like oxidoreductase [Bacillus swezeyi]
MFFGKARQHQQSDRVPPNQNVTTSFPVLHTGHVPDYEDLSKWNLQIYGLLEQPLLLTFDELCEMPQSEVSNDIHCVTGWSKLDNVWKGIKTQEIAKRTKPLEEARFVILHAEEGWMANVPLEDFLMDSSLLAHSHNGVPLTPEHGFPLRAVMPHLYFWKSAKWLRGIQFTKENHPGFWEKNGYHMRGNPWKEERYSFD